MFKIVFPKIVTKYIYQPLLVIGIENSGLKPYTSIMILINLRLKPEVNDNQMLTDFSP